MENAHFSHFGVSDEDQGQYPQRVEPANQAKFDGYSFGDRLLEGVMFIATIAEDGTLSVEITPEHAGYFSGLNQELWLEKALNFALGNDLFEGMNGIEDIGLIMDDGRYNSEWENDINPIGPGIDIPNANILNRGFEPMD